MYLTGELYINAPWRLRSLFVYGSFYDTGWFWNSVRQGFQTFSSTSYLVTAFHDVLISYCRPICPTDDDSIICSVSSVARAFMIQNMRYRPPLSLPLHYFFPSSEIIFWLVKGSVIASYRKNALSVIQEGKIAKQLLILFIYGCVMHTTSAQFY